MKTQITFLYFVFHCFTFCQLTLHQDDLKESKHKIAIIGGGIGGTAAAYFLKELFGLKADLQVFEPQTIGGRLATTNILGKEYETGGTIIHSKNQYMADFIQEFNLTKNIDCDGVLGIFDGQDFVFKGSDWDIITTSKFLWRYGYDIFRMRNYVSDLLLKFSRIYEHQENGRSFETVHDLLDSMDPQFVDMTRVSFEKHLNDFGFKERFINELATAITRTNYGQMPHSMHAFVGSVALAGAGNELWSVAGGNKQVAQKLLDKSEAKLVKATVSSIARTESGKFKVSSYSDSTKNSGIYDAVIIAYPITNDSDIEIDDSNLSPKSMETIFCTLVHGQLNNDNYFAMDDLKVDEILTTGSANWFNSVGLLHPTGEMTCDKNMSSSSVYKVFSKAKLSPIQMRRIFKSWDISEEIEWKAYPSYSVRESLGRFQLSPGLYYSNSIEWAASAMEMSAISAKNSALLSYKYLTGLDPTRMKKDEL